MCHQDLVWPMKKISHGIPPSHQKFSLGQLGGHGHPNADCLQQEGMVQQRQCKEFPKETGQQTMVIA